MLLLISILLMIWRITSYHVQPPLYSRLPSSLHNSNDDQTGGKRNSAGWRNRRGPSKSSPITTSLRPMAFVKGEEGSFFSPKIFPSLLGLFLTLSLLNPFGMLFPNDTSNKIFFYSSNESYTITQDESGERRIDSKKSVKTNLKNFLEEYEFDDK